MPLTVESDVPLLSVRGIRKAFSGAPALSDGSLELHRGEVHALCGGNGAGKSTLLNILMGVLQPDAGEIRVKGAPARFANTRQPLDAGLAMVQQEISLVPDLTVAENIFLGAEPRRFGFVDYRRMNRNAAEVLRSIGCDLDPGETVRRLSIASRQLVEIAKALSHRNAEILIFDEPTSAIGEKDAARLFQVFRDLAAAGKGIIFVTHRIAEVFEIATSYTVLRDGARVSSGAVAAITPETLIETMVGTPVSREFVARNRPGPTPVLEVEDLSANPRCAGIGFTLHEGELLGIYGRVGSGRTETLEAIYGLRHADSGSVAVLGRRLRGGNPAESLDAGLAYVPEDRKRNGLVLGASVRDNLSLSVLGRIERAGFVNAAEETRRTQAVMGRLRIRSAGAAQEVRSLSGGNQQKVVLGRSILCEPKVLLLDEPTRGVDVAAKHEIYRFVAEFTSAGGAAVIVSSEMEEILGMSDRILVLRNGRISACLSKEEATQNRLVMEAD
ncbi:MAG: sugar ABC transporter ATP-binding protein [Acidobacteriia bacterium]|nr:sugar ABC transporter ATP-binding protein [Terriglobia bacterium]